IVQGQAAASGRPNTPGPRVRTRRQAGVAGGMTHVVRLGDAMLEVSGLKKRFGTVVAVDGGSFQVGRGEIVGLLGPNGPGKTTTVSMICGLLRPADGQVLVDSRPIHDRRISRTRNLPNRHSSSMHGAVRPDLRWHGASIAGRQGHTICTDRPPSHG